MKIVAILVIFWGILSIADPNGPFGAPQGSQIESLSDAEKRLYDQNFAKVKDAFYFSDQGQRELEEAAQRIWSRLSDYSRVVFIGRSPTGIMAYLQGRQLATGLHSDVQLTDLPFSYGEKVRITSEMREGLRAHLARNGLDPESLNELSKPVLFVDFVYTGTGAATLVKEIHQWGGHKKAIHFLGFYPARGLAMRHLQSLYHDMKGETKLKYQDFVNEAEIKKTMAEMVIPNKFVFEEHASRVIGEQISSELYGYAGNKAPNSQLSLKYELWATRLNPETESQNSYLGKSEDPAYLELYHLTRLGMTQKICDQIVESL